MAHQRRPNEHPYQRPEPPGETTQESRQFLGDYGRSAGSAAGHGTLGREEGNVAPGDTPDTRIESSIRHSGPYHAYGPRNYRRSDDRIQEDICERLSDHGAIDAREMEVHVSGGVATLTGTVATEDMRSRRTSRSM